MILHRPGPPYLVYLLHLDKPVAHARHYIGLTRPHQVHTRMLQHVGGRGARLLKIAASQGIGFTLVKSWAVTDPLQERQIKRRYRSKRLCPICSPGLTDHTNLCTPRHYSPPAAVQTWRGTAWQAHPRKAHPHRS